MKDKVKGFVFAALLIYGYQFYQQVQLHEKAIDQIVRFIQTGGR